jgi:serine/threonine protein phosphatase PrpC
MGNAFSSSNLDKTFEAVTHHEIKAWRCMRSGYGLKPKLRLDNTDDRTFFMTNGMVTLQGIFDGHGGSRCSDYLNQFFPGFLIEAITPVLSSEIAEHLIHDALRPVITQAFLDFNIKIHASHVTGGSTATIVIFTKHFGTVCYVGDSPFLVKTQDGQILAKMTIDHSPDNLDEVARVLRLGGRIGSAITGSDMKYVFDDKNAQCIASTRSFGHSPDNCGHDAIISAVPDFVTFEIPVGKIIMSFLFTDFVTEMIVNVPEPAIRNARDFADVIPQIPSDIDPKAIEISLPTFVDNIVESFRFEGTYCGDNACVNYVIIPPCEVAPSVSVRDVATACVVTERDAEEPAAKVRVIDTSASGV